LKYTRHDGFLILNGGSVIIDFDEKNVVGKIMLGGIQMNISLNIFFRKSLPQLIMQIKGWNLMTIENEELRLSKFSKLGKSLS
jgi:hypothetical protein